MNTCMKNRENKNSPSNYIKGELINMKYDNDFKIGFIRCKCGKSLIVKRKSFLGFKYFKGTCRHCGTKVRIRKIKKEKLIAKIIYWQRNKKIPQQVVKF